MKSIFLFFMLFLLSIAYASDTDGLPDIFLPSMSNVWIPSPKLGPKISVDVDPDEAMPYYGPQKSIFLRFTDIISGYDSNGFQSILSMEFQGGKTEYLLDPNDNIYQILNSTKSYFMSIDINSWIGYDNENGYWLIFNIPIGYEEFFETDTELVQETFSKQKVDLIPGSIIQFEQFLILIE